MRDAVRRRSALGARAALAWGVLAATALASPAAAYPLDGDEATGIIRLRGYREHQERLLKNATLHPGSLWGMDEVGLRLLDHPEVVLPEKPDAALSRRLTALLGAEADRYGVAVFDLSDPDAPHYLAHRPDQHQNPGSVGKLVVGLAWFQALADLHPESPAARAALLRETQVVADSFIRSDHHEVPFWQPGDERIAKRRLREGDRGNLYTYLDWMFSSSSNAAASMLQQQLVLLRHFGLGYPAEEPVWQAYLAETPRRELGQALSDAMLEPLARNGLDSGSFRQGGFFSHEGKRRMPAGDSTATPAELVRYLLRMEQGRLVDPWSSLELKRLMYLTERRIRYASHPALKNAAIYFKSGSLYQCQPEEGFVCGKYKGNVRNYMNSVAIIETREPGRELHYLVAVLSNVLRENSAVAHQTLALRIHRLIESLHPVKRPPDPPPELPSEVPPAAPPVPATAPTPEASAPAAEPPALDPEAPAPSTLRETGLGTP